MSPENFRVGVLVPLSRPGWFESGRHLLAGFELGAADAGNLTLEVRDTAGDPRRAAALVEELADLRNQEPWSAMAVNGTRGTIRFSRVPGSNVWQWAWPPVQVVDIEPADPERLRVLFSASSARAAPCR